MISWAHDGEAMSPPVACHSVFAGFTVYRSPINSPPEFFYKILLLGSCWELDLAKPRAPREAPWGDVRSEISKTPFKF